MSEDVHKIKYISVYNYFKRSVKITILKQSCNISEYILNFLYDTI